MQQIKLKNDSRTLSDLDEEGYDAKLIMTHEMYETRKPKVVGTHILNGEVLAFEAIDRAINRSVEIIYDKYIDSKKKGHVMNSTFNLVEIVLSSELTFFDNEIY
jgi:hypothetical protein